MGNDETASGGTAGGGQSGKAPPQRPGDLPQGSPYPAPRCLRSEDLFSGQAEILIVHEGETYRLRVTRNGKLILHK